MRDPSEISRAFEAMVDGDVDREWGDAPAEQPDPEFSDDDPVWD